MQVYRLIGTILNSDKTSTIGGHGTVLVRDELAQLIVRRGGRYVRPCAAISRSSLRDSLEQIYEIDRDSRGSVQAGQWVSCYLCGVQTKRQVCDSWETQKTEPGLLTNGPNFSLVMVRTEFTRTSHTLATASIYITLKFAAVQ